MEPAANVLVTAGVLALAVGLLIGFSLARRRARQPADELRYLQVAHEGALLQGFLMLGLSLAVGLSDLGSRLELAAAWLVVAAAVFNTAAGLVNFRQKVTDQFAQRSVGLRLNTINSLLVAPGVGIFVVGVIRGL